MGIVVRIILLEIFQNGLTLGGREASLPVQEPFPLGGVRAVKDMVFGDVVRHSGRGD